MGEPKKKNFIDDFADTFKGFGNVVSGRIFDAKSWDPASLSEVKETKPNDDGEEVEEVRTVRRTKRGTFGAAPTPKQPKAGDDTGPGQSGTTDSGKGKTEGEQK